MDIKEILSITGKPGLYKIISTIKTGMIVESLIDKKRIPIYPSDKISKMKDIYIFTTEEDMALIDIFKIISEKENGGKAISHKADDKKIREYFEQVLPTYDKERVYTSDIKKVFNWYNQLQENNMLDFSEKEEVIEEATEVKDVVAEDKPKTVEKSTDNTKSATPKKTVKAKKETDTE